MDPPQPAAAGARRRANQRLVQDRQRVRVGGVSGLRDESEASDDELAAGLSPLERALLLDGAEGRYVNEGWLDDGSQQAPQDSDIMSLKSEGEKTRTWAVRPAYRLIYASAPIRPRALRAPAPAPSTLPALAALCRTSSWRLTTCCSAGISTTAGSIRTSLCRRCPKRI